jgi:hypothetical protein
MYILKKDISPSSQKTDAQQYFVSLRSITQKRNQNEDVDTTSIINESPSKKLRSETEIAFEKNLVSNLCETISNFPSESRSKGKLRS